MTKKNVFESKMKLYEDNQSDIAEALGISPQTFNKKLNGTDGAEFTQTEIKTVKIRYHLTPEEVDEIFLT